jgi:NitT/TauT family transport system ATP-binding protein
MLMDEPFSALDEVLRQQLCETCLQLWQREAWTTVFVTHNVSEAVFMSQKVFILAGRPATIVDVIEVPFETRIGDLRVSAEFIRLVTDVSQRLRRAVELDDSVAERQ